MREQWHAKGIYKDDSMYLKVHWAVRYCQWAFSEGYRASKLKQQAVLDDFFLVIDLPCRRGF